MNGTERKNIKPGIRVKIVQKQHQRTGQLTEGVVQDHPDQQRRPSPRY